MEVKELVIGIDLGSSDSYVGFISKGVVDIVLNEVSQRKTPSLVGFTDKTRLLGDTALSQIKSNTKNTCRNFKHLLGQTMESPGVREEEFWSCAPIVKADDGAPGFSVQHKGETKVFSAIQVTAMFLTKLKEITETWCGGQVADVVIGVPSYFSDTHRKALLDAAHIADMNVLRVMNEHTATALAYGIYRTNDFDPEKPMTVAFCSMGHVVFSVSIVQFVRGKLVVLCERSAKVGGRDMDECLMRTFAEQFKKKTSCDPLSNKKPAFKLEDSVTKTKKILSANTEASIAVECLMEDEDFGSNISRADFLEMCKPMMQKVNDVLEEAKALAGLPVSAIDAVEMCGGACRVPWVKEMCSKAFGNKELSTTMNADECVARGCALQAAMLSPLYKVREFKIEDSSPFAVSLSYMPPAGVKPPGGEDKKEDGAEVVSATKSVVVFPAKSIMNLVKLLTFFRKETFELKARYNDEKAVLPGTAPELGTFTIEVPSQPEPKKVKVKALLTANGTFSIPSAQLVEEEEYEETVKEKKVQEDSEKEEEPAEATTDEAKRKRSEGKKEDWVEVTTRKKRYKRTDLTVVASGLPGLGKDALDRCRAGEETMKAETRELVETLSRRNDLEAYILAMRGGAAEGGKYSDFIMPEEREPMRKSFMEAEDWLYDHIDDPKQVYTDKLAELKKLGGPAEQRCREATQRPELEAALRGAIRRVKALREKPEVKRQADAASLRTLEEGCKAAEAWLAEMVPKQEKLLKHVDPVLDCAGLERRVQELERLAAGCEEALGSGTPGPEPATAMDVD